MRGDDPERIGGFCGNALQGATYGGHTVVVQRLLIVSADPNAVSGYYGTLCRLRHTVAIIQLQICC